MRRLRDSTKVFALNLIWRLFTMQQSLWVSLIQHYLMKEGSFWDVRDDAAGSWIWRKLLKMRPLAYQFFFLRLVMAGMPSFGLMIGCMLGSLLISLERLVLTIWVLNERREFAKLSRDWSGVYGGRGVGTFTSCMTRFRTNQFQVLMVGTI